MRLRARFRVLSILCVASLMLAGVQVAPLAAAPSVEAQGEVSAQFDGSQRFWGLDTDTNDFFGQSMDVDGNYAVVGAYGCGVGGAAYVFEFADGFWYQRAKLVATDATADDWFGMAVAIDGDTVVVGAPDDGPSVGSAYVFTRSGDTWSQQAKITGPSTMIGDYFGMALDLDAGTLAIGSESHGTGGAVFVYTGAGASWALQQEFTGTDTVSGNRFGGDVKVAGDTIVVGAIYHASNGAAYVFTRAAGVWSERTQLVADDGSATDQFGDSISISGGTIAVGAPRTDQSGNDTGKVYLFSGSGADWTQDAALDPADIDTDDWFGVSVSLEGERLLVGAYMGGPSGRGSVHAYENKGGTWKRRTVIDRDEDLTSSFGMQVALTGDMALVTAPQDSLHGASSGLAYAFSPVFNDAPLAFDDPMSFNSQSDLVADDAAEYAFYGEDIALQGTVAVVGAPGAHAGAGSAYVYEKADGAWTQVAELASSDPNDYDAFGKSVDVDNGTIVVGEYADSDVAGGSVHVFTKVGGIWTHRAKLTASDGTYGAALGCSVAISGDTIIAGAYNAGTRGAAYTFTGSGATWSEEHRFSGTDVGDEFGWDVDIDGDVVLIGATGVDGPGFNVGAAYIGNRDETGAWTLAPALMAGDPLDSDYFGLSVALSQGVALVGAKGHEGPSPDNWSGAAYAFEGRGDDWAQSAKLVPNDSTAQAAFGTVVAFDGRTAIIGAPGIDGQGRNGNAYSFTYDGSTWTQEHKWGANSPVANGMFGDAAAVDGNSCIVGSYGAQPAGTGSGAAAMYDSYYTVNEHASMATDELLIVPAPGVLSNDRDPNGDTIAVQGTFQAAHGTVMQNTEGYFEYNPDDHFYGFDSFEYQVYDGQAYSQRARVDIFVMPVHHYIAVQGADRFETGAKAALEGFGATGAPTVIVATGRNFPDALGGSALAGALGAPLMLVDTNSVPTDVAEALAQLGTTETIILGGEKAVTPAVVTQLVAAMGPGSTTKRISGADRYETARKVAKSTIDELGASFDGTAFVATGKNFPDALAAGPIAASAGWPIYLASNSSADEVTFAEMETRGVTDAKVVGGEAVVTGATYGSLVARFGAGGVRRYDGLNRYETAVEVSQMGVNDAGMTWNGLGIATGTGFPDALAAGAMLGAHGSPLLLSTPSTLSGETRTVLRANRAGLYNVYFFGGLGALSQDVRDGVFEAIELP